MNKSWVGYLASAMIFFGGILMLAGGKTLAGIVFILAAIIGAVIKFRMYK
jgi:hypothetical protein